MSGKQELNGNKTRLGKRKIIRSKKKNSPPKSHLQSWLEQSNEVYEHYNSVPPNYTPYWQPVIPSQRLYPAVSDPSVCNYPPVGMPMRYRVEPSLSLPVYPMCQPWQNGSNNSIYMPQNISTRSSGKPKPAVSTDSVYSSTKNNESVHNQEFKSLPPVIVDQLIDDSENKRRFSDPGIAIPLSDSAGSSGHSSVRTVDNKESQIIFSLMEQINSLKENNRRLFRDLHDIKTELTALKQQAASWSRRERDYAPGALSDVIREIRDAAKIREDALITKVRHMIEEKNFSRTYIAPAVHGNREIDDFRARLVKLEEELQNLKLNTSRANGVATKQDERTQSNSFFDRSTNVSTQTQLKRSVWSIFPQMFSLAPTPIQGLPDTNLQHRPPIVRNLTRNSTLGDNPGTEDEGGRLGANQVLELEQETLQLRRDLQEAVAGRKQAEAKNMKYERQFNTIQQHHKSPIFDLTSVSNDNNSPNSLDELKDSSSQPSGVDIVTVDGITAVHVTLSGPVTDL